MRTSKFPFGCDYQRERTTLGPNSIAAIRATAKKLYVDHSDNNIEIDDEARISRNNEGGAWVAAWVYVRDDEVRR